MNEATSVLDICLDRGHNGVTQIMNQPVAALGSYPSYSLGLVVSICKKLFRSRRG